MISEQFQIFNNSCYGLHGLQDSTIDSLVTDPPYGISYQNNYRDKDLPNSTIRDDCFRVMKPGAYGLIFCATRLMHRLMVNLEDSGFIIKDVLMRSYLNGMPKSRDVSLDIDKEFGVVSQVVGKYNYVQGYKKGGADSYKIKGKDILSTNTELGKKYKGCGLGIKPMYEPIIMIQKPIDKGLNVAQNIIKYGTGSLNLEQTRIPYEPGEGKVGHNPHKEGRVVGNILRVDELNDGYDKFFLVPKVRQHKDDYNFHPTIKPIDLMSQLIKLVTINGQNVLDPFMGSGSTGVSCLLHKRFFYGYEMDKEYYKITINRLGKNTHTHEGVIDQNVLGTKNKSKKDLSSIKIPKGLFELV